MQIITNYRILQRGHATGSQASIDLRESPATRALLQFAAQGYFVYRYYSLLRNQTLHQINAVLFTALIVGETTLYLATFPLTLDSRLRHFQETTEFDGTVHMSTAIRDINVAVHILAAIINCGLAVVFAQRMRQMNHEVAPDPAASALFGRAIKVIVACALTSGIATTIGALAIALWFIIANDLKVGLIAEVQPHLYATSLLVALLSREKIRQEVRKNEVAKVSAAMAGVDERLASVSAASPLSAAANDPLSSLPFAAIDLEKAKGPLTPRSGLLSLTAPPVLGARAGSGGRVQSNDENAGPTPGRSTFHKSPQFRQWSTSLASDHTALGLEQQAALEQDTNTPIMAAPNAQTLRSRRSACALDSATAEGVKFMPSLLERVEMEQLDDLGLPPARRSSEITAVDPAMASHQPRN